MAIYPLTCIISTSDVAMNDPMYFYLEHPCAHIGQSSEDGEKTLPSRHRIRYSQAEHSTSQSRGIPTIFNIYE